MSRKKEYESHRIDEHATYAPAPKRPGRPSDRGMDRNRQDKGVLNGPSERDEAPEALDEAMKRAGGERINPILASRFIDQLMKEST